MRKPLLAGNWKMHGSQAFVANLVNGIKEGSTAYPGIEICVCPTFVHLQQVHQLLAHTQIQLGAQNLYIGEQGAFTGEISGVMLKDLGCTYVLIGHSERRSLFGENLEIVAGKFQAAIAAGLKPVLCIGETKVEREKNETDAILRRQVESVIALTGVQAFKQAVIAYEPVWAIGTGLTATPDQAQTAHAYIRSLIGKNSVDIANSIRILYGGSMKADNAAALLAMPDIDGGLIGGASLDAQQFLAICAAAGNEITAAKTG